MNGGLLSATAALAALLSSTSAAAATTSCSCPTSYNEHGKCPVKLVGVNCEPPKPKARTVMLARLVHNNWEGLKECKGLASSAFGGLTAKQEDLVEDVETATKQLEERIKSDAAVFQGEFDAIEGRVGAVKELLGLVKRLGGIRATANALNGSSSGNEALFKCMGSSIDLMNSCLERTETERVKSIDQARAVADYFETTASVKCFRAAGNLIAGMKQIGTPYELRVPLTRQ